MFYRFIITPITYYVNRVLFLFLFSFKEMIFQHLLTLFHIFLIIMPIITIGFKRVVLHACPNHFIRAKVCITKSEISMRTWRSPMSAASQGAFVVIPEISLCDISGIIKSNKQRPAQWRISPPRRPLFVLSCSFMLSNLCCQMSALAIPAQYR